MTELIGYLLGRAEMEDFEVKDADIELFVSNKVDNGDLLDHEDGIDAIQVEDEELDGYWFEFQKFIRDQE